MWQRRHVINLKAHDSPHAMRVKPVEDRDKRGRARPRILLHATMGTAGDTLVRLWCGSCYMLIV
ncbi:hypothetical protein PgNI_06527 [Pyricularia grisea]|uniref:Uncharacterized protein n=1 Tax=Pyricularia grisea TaxID=148305 RepID=A0A6P8B3M2_PYRGI|nr:hypothetical protein PgNI_06527 [Pyricularia grisea]TLD09868.1 hypothetical protein PgNI_06527 [Pyricularia grisea]